MEYRSHASARAEKDEAEHAQQDTPLQDQQPWYGSHQNNAHVNQTLYSPVRAHTIARNVPKIAFIPSNSLYGDRNIDGEYSSSNPIYPLARSPIIFVEEKNIWDPDIPLNIPWELQGATSSSGRYLHRNDPIGDEHSQETLTKIQSTPKCNANWRRTGPIIAWGSPSDRILKRHANKGLRDPIASSGLTSRSNKESESSNSCLRFQESRNGNESPSTPLQLAKDECDLKRSLFVKKLPKIHNLKEQLCHLFEDAGFKPTKVTFPSDVSRFRDFGFIEFSSTEIANKAMLVMDGAMFRGKKIKVEKRSMTKVSHNDEVLGAVGRKTR